MTKPPDLLPCPYCGKRMKVIALAPVGHTLIRCSWRGDSHGEFFRTTLAAAIRAANKRAKKWR